MIEIEPDEFPETDFDGFELSSRDHALFLMRERDLEAQLIAIKAALKRNNVAEREASENIRAMSDQVKLLDPRDSSNADHLNDIVSDMLHESVYNDAAHSMSAVGMLAPFVEALFVSIFAGLQVRAQQETSPDPRAKATEKQYWNPQIVFGKTGPRDDIVAGIKQLATSTGLQPLLPNEYEKALSALFGYRNNMFHNGFEWPFEARQKFIARISSEKWSNNWFSQATTNDEPWIIYMSDVFIDHCLLMIDKVLEGVGKYVSNG